MSQLPDQLAGGPTAPGFPGVPATVGDRFAARLLDTLILVGFLAVFGGLGQLAGEESPASTALSLIAIGVLFGYECVAIATFGHTFGKKIMRLQVVHVSGDPAGWGSSAARAFVPGLASCFSCGLLGFLFYLSPLFDSSPWKRGWHDQIASTVVIKVPRFAD